MLDNCFDYSVDQLKVQAHKVRVDLIKALAHAGSGHSGGPLGFADVVTAVYFKFARFDPDKPRHPDRDRVIFSAGHYSPLIYSVLAHAGFCSIKQFIARYRQFDGVFDGHPNLHTPGIENPSGPLGQGTSIAAGIASAGTLARKNWRVWLMMSDGEQQEGQVQEALMWIGHRKLSNIIGIIDANNMQIDGHVADVMPEDWLVKNYTNYGWYVLEVDGNDMKSIVDTLTRALHVRSKPVLVVARTTPGKGVSFMENDYHWHGKPPMGDEVDRALADLDRVGIKLGLEYR